MTFVTQSMRHKGPGEWEANVVHVDRFGNLTTSLYERETVPVRALEGQPLFAEQL